MFDCTLNLRNVALTAATVMGALCAQAQSVPASNMHFFATANSALFMDAGRESSSNDVAPAPASGAAFPNPAMPLVTHGTKPFSAVAVSFRVGSTGIGAEIATPLSRHLAIRSGASFFSYNTSFTTNGLNITGGLHLQNASTSVDIYPFHSSFRISPGLTFANKNRMSATLLVPGGQSFSLGDGGNYYSDPSNPVHGTASFIFGNSLAPRLTMGFESLAPRRGRVSFPLDLGFQYTAQPVVKLAITGNSCGTQVQADGTTDAGCGSVDQTNVAQEQSQLQDDIKMLRFYPILSFGVTVKFGHVSRSN